MDLGIPYLQTSPHTVPWFQKIHRTSRLLAPPCQTRGTLWCPRHHQDREPWHRASLGRSQCHRQCQRPTSSGMDSTPGTQSSELWRKPLMPTKQARSGMLDTADTLMHVQCNNYPPHMQKAREKKDLRKKILFRICQWRCWVPNLTFNLGTCLLRRHSPPQGASHRKRTHQGPGSASPGSHPCNIFPNIFPNVFPNILRRWVRAEAKWSKAFRLVSAGNHGREGPKAGPTNYLLHHGDPLEHRWKLNAHQPGLALGHEGTLVTLDPKHWHKLHVL